MSPEHSSRAQKATPMLDWKAALALWVIVGGVCVVLAHTLAAGML